MRLLIDTNIVLEILLQQEKAKAAKNLLEDSAHQLFISDYSLHSIGILLFRRQQLQSFWQFVQDMILNAGMELVVLQAEDMEIVVQTAQQSRLDFDDTYQYAIAKKHDLTIVSFDTDFDRTDRGRRTPEEL
jgi:predicted nucleic acid-binding protein